MRKVHKKELQGSIHEKEKEKEEEEKILASLLYIQNRKQSSHPKAHIDENKIAYAVKIWQEKGQAPTEIYSSTLLEEASHILFAEKKMQSNPESLASLPSALARTLEASLAKYQKRHETKEEKSPSIIVEIFQDSIRVLKSTLDCFGDVFQPVTQSRGLPQVKRLEGDTLETDEEKQANIDLQDGSPYLKANYAKLSQKVKEEYLEYELVRDNNHCIGLVITAPERLRKSKAVLKKGERTILAQHFNMKDGLLKFRHLQPGNYKLEFSGTMEYSLTLAIRFRLDKTRVQTSPYSSSS